MPRKVAGLPSRKSARWEARGDLPRQIADFEPRKMVAWFSPIQLLRTAIRTFFSQLIASHIDRRETLAALDSRANRGQSADKLQELIEADFAGCEGKKEVWIDYISDMGDGWDSAYTMSLLLSRDKLRIAGLDDPSLYGAKTGSEPEGQLHSDELPRADVLVLGGDQVYPVPSRDGYTDRLVAPLVCAFPPPTPRPGDPSEDDTKTVSPLLFAVPGNHDWYDGLTDFVRVFCQRSLIGRWKTTQRRSYFALRLPFDWWLWGIDIQLDTRIDPVQLEHFRSLARVGQDEDSQPKKIILCTAQPSWIYGQTGRETCYKNLMYFEEQVTRPGPADRRGPGTDGRDLGGGVRTDQEKRTAGRNRASVEIPVTLAGDLHHYSRYEEFEEDRRCGVDERPRQRITCGAGGAYLRGTHDLPRQISRPDRPSRRRRGRGEDARSRGELIETGYPYPSRQVSRRLSYRALRLPLFRHNWSFCLALGLAYTALAAAIGIAGWAESAGRPFEWLGLFDYVTALRPQWDALRDFSDRTLQAFDARAFAVALAVVGVFMGAAFAIFFNASVGNRFLLFLWGGLHGLAHVALTALVAWGISGLIANGFGLGGRWYEPLVHALVVLIGGVAGGFLVGAYLVLSSLLFGLHDNEVFALQSNPDFRSFLRLRIGKNGDLTIYPIGVRNVPRRWRRSGQRLPGDPHFEPADDVLPGPHLIEPPIVIKRRQEDQKPENTDALPPHRGMAYFMAAKS